MKTTKSAFRKWQRKANPAKQGAKQTLKIKHPNDE